MKIKITNFIVADFYCYSECSPAMCNSSKEKNKKYCSFLELREVDMVKAGKAIGFVNTCKKRVKMGLDREWVLDREGNESGKENRVNIK